MVHLSQATAAQTTWTSVIKCWALARQRVGHGLRSQPAIAILSAASEETAVRITSRSATSSLWNGIWQLQLRVSLHRQRQARESSAQGMLCLVRGGVVNSQVDLACATVTIVVMKMEIAARIRSRRVMGYEDKSPCIACWNT